ncbi:putative P-loop containing nucleoside triphosphate hydrolase [Helianthus debilis subsp. tardiflorus]
MQVNLLFAAGVVEEEIDLPNCSTVICFDIPKMVHDNVQQWRRVCQSGCPCVMMIERGIEKEREHVCDIIRSEHSMNNNARKRDHDPRVVKACNAKETEPYRVEATGDSVTADSSISLIRRDCPADNSSSVSKQLLCLETSKILHQMGLLTYHVPPNNEAPPKKKSSENTKESPPLGADKTENEPLEANEAMEEESSTVTASNTITESTEFLGLDHVSIPSVSLS